MFCFREYKQSKIRSNGTLYLQFIKILGLTMPSLDSPSELQKPISQRRLPMIDMRDNRKVANPFRRVLA